MRTRLINLYGAPAAGKTTKMFELALAARLKGLNCEACPEVAKEYAIRRIPMTAVIQTHVTTEQHRRLSCYVGHTDHLITDAPVMIGAFYAIASAFPEAPTILEMCKNFARDLSAHAEVVNLFVLRDHPYVAHGRYQDETEAVRMADTMLAYVREHHPDSSILVIRSSDSPESIWSLVDSHFNQAGRR